MELLKAFKSFLSSQKILSVFFSISKRYKMAVTILRLPYYGKKHSNRHSNPQLIVGLPLSVLHHGRPSSALVSSMAQDL